MRNDDDTYRPRTRRRPRTLLAVYLLGHQEAIDILRDAGIDTPKSGADLDDLDMIGRAFLTLANAPRE